MINYFRSNYWLRSGSYSLFTRLSVATLGIVNFLVLARITDLESFGIWTLFVSLVALVESLRNAFIYNPLLSLLGEKSSEEKISIMSMSFLMNLGLGILSSVLLFVSSYFFAKIWNAPDLIKMLKIYTIGSLLYTWFSHYNFIGQANLSFKGTFYSTLIQKIPFTLYLAFVYMDFTRFSLVNGSLIFISGYFFSTMLSFYQVLHWRGFTFKLSKSNLLELFHFGKYTLGTNLGSMLSKNSSDWLLGVFVGVSGVALFNPALRVSNLIEMPLGAAAQIIYPKMVSTFKSDNFSGVKSFFIKSIILIVLAILPISGFIFIFSDSIIYVIAGDKFYEASDILRIICLSGVFVPFMRIFGVTMNAIGKAKINFYYMTSTMFFSIVATFLGVKYFGIMGAASSYLIVSIVSALLSVFIVIKELKVNFSDIFVSLSQLTRKANKLISLI